MDPQVLSQSAFRRETRHLSVLWLNIVDLRKFLDRMTCTFVHVVHVASMLIIWTHKLTQKSEVSALGRIISIFKLKETLLNLVSFSLNFFFTNVMFVCRSSYHLPLHLRLNGRSIKLSGPDTIYWKFVTQIPSRDDLDVPPRRLYPTKCGNFSAELKPAKKDQCPLLLGMWTNTFYNLN